MQSIIKAQLETSRRHRLLNISKLYRLYRNYFTNS